MQLICSHPFSPTEMSASHSTYNRTLDEILGFSTAVSKSPDRPKPPPRRLSASRSSENSIGSVTAAKRKSHVNPVAASLI